LREKERPVNTEHLALLKQDVKRWNEWRRNNTPASPDLRYLRKADLREADLTGADLRGADLRKADLRNADLTRAYFRGAHLREADLREADLTGAHLAGAHLSWADLTRARLTGAHLRGTNLRDTDLREADLTGADLSRVDLSTTGLSLADLREAKLHGADLSRADLTGAHFSGADLYETVMADVDLSRVGGLDCCVHLRPSILDHRTLQRSGRLPLVFLRGCGLPDKLIESLPDLFNEPIQFYSCFISFSTRDQEFADRLYADLQNKGVRCWFSLEDMKIGDEIRPRIEQSIRAHDKLLLVLSQNSIRSWWVKGEAETAFERERREGGTVLFPIRLDNEVMETDEAWAAEIRRTRHIGDFTGSKDRDAYQKALSRLLRDLKKAAESTPGAKAEGDLSGQD
jgi:uncharacterized protein YjbI with pentapeptide repeats